MHGRTSLEGRGRAWRRITAAGLLLSCAALGYATDWTQYRGPMGDGFSPDPAATKWATNSPGFVVWTNSTLTNGFSSFAVSRGRAFTLCSRRIGGSLREVCATVDAATGTDLWATVIDNAPWDYNSTGNGGSGTAPYNKGDGPRGTPTVQDGRVFALSGQMRLVCLNATNGAVLWSNNLASAYGASTISWDNAASPRLDGDLIFVNLNSAVNGQTLSAFRSADGQRAWSSQNEGMTHTTPVVATIEGVRQVIFATATGLVSLNCTNGAWLWKFSYPFGSISTSMGASPLVYSNIVYCAASYGKGAAAARITVAGGAWTATQLYYKTGSTYRNMWMTPVCYEGYVYTLSGDSGTFLTTPLNCIDLSTGELKWSVKNFGMGGLILVNTNLLVLSEDGQLVLVRPNPTAYTELARCRAFQFTASAPGKCWNSPAFSDGRIYARGTRGAVCLDVSVPPPPRLRVLSAEFLDSAHFQLVIGTTNGTAIDPARLPQLEVRATDTLGAPPGTWPRLTNELTLASGQVRMTNAINAGQPQLFYIVLERP